MAVLGKNTTPSTPTFGFVSTGSHMQVAMNFTTTQPGLYTSVSFWAAGSSTLTIHGVIWSSGGSVLAFGPGQSTSGGHASGTGASTWYTDTFSTPLYIASGTNIWIGWQANSAATVDFAFNGNDHSPDSKWNTASGSTGQAFSAGSTSATYTGAVAAYATYTPYVTPSISGFSPTVAAPGNTITISGSGFTGVSSVAFNGTSASYAFVSDTSITATVPSGATAGPISVTNPAGTGTSSTNFQPGQIWYGTGAAVNAVVAVWYGTGSGVAKVAGIWVPNGAGVKRVW